MSLYDTPDHQAGVYSGQQLLATVSAGTGLVTVTLPPNAQTIVVTILSTIADVQANCFGVTTGMLYPGARLWGAGGTVVWWSYYFNVSNAVDAQVTIELATTPGVEWFVYADAAAHCIADVSARSDQNGVRYDTPTAPSLQTGDHPPVEILYTNVDNQAGSIAVVPAPGAGKRLRLFFIDAYANTAAAEWQVGATAPGPTAVYFSNGRAAAGSAPPPTVLPLTGMACATNTAVILFVAAGNCGCTVGYTIEIV